MEGRAREIILDERMRIEYELLWEGENRRLVHLDEVTGRWSGGGWSNRVGTLYELIRQT